ASRRRRRPGSGSRRAGSVSTSTPPRRPRRASDSCGALFLLVLWLVLRLVLRPAPWRAALLLRPSRCGAAAGGGCELAREARELAPDHPRHLQHRDVSGGRDPYEPAIRERARQRDRAGAQRGP